MTTNGKWGIVNDCFIFAAVWRVRTGDEILNEILFKASHDSYVQKVKSWAKANQGIIHSIIVQTKGIYTIANSKGSINV